MAAINIENFDAESTKRCESALIRKTSIAAVLTELVKQHIPTERELAARHAYFERPSKVHAKSTPEGVKFKSTEEALRENRNR